MVPIAIAPVKAPIDAGIKVLHGQTPSTRDLVGVAVPGAAQIQAAAEQNIPGAALAATVVQAPVDVPLNLIATIKNVRDRTDELQQTIAGANATEDSIQQAADAVRQATENASETMQNADALVLSGQAIIDRALDILDEVDVTTAEGRATLIQVNQMLATGKELIAKGTARASNIAAK